MLTIESSWRRFFSSFSSVDDFFTIEGKVARQVKGRKVMQFEREGESFYIKCHWGVGWKEIVKNWLQLKRPVLGARDEWEAIHKLHEIGVETLEPVAFGEQGSNPASRRSFIVTKDLGQTVELETFFKKHQDAMPGWAFKRALLYKVASITRVIHEHGINHRDLYICHFEMDIAGGFENLSKDNIQLKLIDLHRAQIRSQIPQRWRVKDVASLYFSAMDIGLSQMDVLRFVRCYTNKPLKKTFREDRDFWKKVTLRTRKLYQRDWGKEPAWILPVS